MIVQVVYVDTTSGKTLQKIELPDATSAPEVGELLDIEVNDTREGHTTPGLLKFRVDQRMHRYLLDHTPHGTAVQTYVYCVCSLLQS